MNLGAEATARASAEASYGAIPWDREHDTLASVSNVIKQLCRTFDSSYIMQLAFDTLAGELLHSRLQWADSVTGKPLADVDVPTGYDQVVVECLRGILVCGACFYRKGKDRPIVVAHPTETYYGSKWKALVVYPPYPFAYCNATVVNSPVFRAAAYDQRLREHSELHANRDRTNSRPGVFVAIDKRIQQETRNKPWFRTVGPPAATNSTLSGSLDPLNEDLDHLVDDRAQVIANLSASTIATRQTTAARDSYADKIDMYAKMRDASGKVHREHIITDGYEGTPTPQLQSLADSRQEKTDLENTVLYMLGVAPSVVGRNVNSERLSSANQLVMHSLHTYRTTIDRLRRVIGGMLKEMTVGSNDKHPTAFVQFSIAIYQHDLAEVLPHLTPDAARNAFAATYNIPREWLDKKSFVVPPPGEEQSASTSTQPQKKRRVEEKAVDKAKNPALHTTEAPNN